MLVNDTHEEIFYGEKYSKKLPSAGCKVLEEVIESGGP